MIQASTSLTADKTYGIDVKQETVKVIENNPASSLVVDDIQIAPNALVENGNHLLSVKNKIQSVTLMAILQELLELTLQVLIQN